jgi:phage antirepressor YoqD-like protein
MKTVKELAKALKANPRRIRNWCRDLGVKMKGGQYHITEAQAKRIAKNLKK